MSSRKISPEQIVAAREAYAAGGVTQEEIASSLGVTRQAVSDFLRGRTYRRVGWANSSTKKREHRETSLLARIFELEEALSSKAMELARRPPESRIAEIKARSSDLHDRISELEQRVAEAEGRNEELEFRLEELTAPPPPFADRDVPKSQRAIIGTLLRRPGQIVSHDALLAAMGSDSLNSLKVNMVGVRRAFPEVEISYSWGVGYRAEWRAGASRCAAE